MDLIIDHPVLALEPGQVVTLDDAAGVRIRAKEGTVWVTYEDSLRDLIVGPGETLVITRNGRTVVQALQPTHVSVQSPREHSPEHSHSLLRRRPALDRLDLQRRGRPAGKQRRRRRPARSARVSQDRGLRERRARARAPQRLRNIASP